MSCRSGGQGQGAVGGLIRKTSKEQAGGNVLKQIDFIQKYHNRTKRDYVARVVGHDKAE